MDMSAAVFSAEDWRAVLVSIEGIGPYLILALSILLFWNRRRLNRYEDEDDGRSNGRRNYHLAEDPPDYEDELDERKAKGGNGQIPKKIEGPRRAQRKKHRFFLRRSSHLISFLGLIVSTAGICLAILPLIYPTFSHHQVSTTLPAETIPYEPGPTKTPEELRFEAKVIIANQHLARGDTENAMNANREAMEFPNMPIDDNAVPMINIAEMLIEQGQVDRAYWLASIAAGLRSDDPDFVNPFAEVLIETCELDGAVDHLEGLQERKDERSVRLLERIDIRRSECSER